MTLSAYHINKLFHALSVNAELKERYLQDHTAVMNQYQLSMEEQNMIQKNEFAALTEYGVNGLILMRIKDIHQVPVPDMLKSLKSLD